ncbi:MAG: hypothetical protein OQK24_06245 [Magnetovibrio sp.]|nr:hypothetical protein [Magnetovibrio sp.]
MKILNKAYLSNNHIQLMVTSICLSVFLQLCLIALSPNASANEGLLGGRAFSPPSDIIPMGKDWESQPIKHSVNTEVDLAVALDQQLYPAVGPMIETFAKERGVKIAIQDGTCGTSAGLLAQKSADMGGFCCPPGVTDRLPGLKYHTIGIGALALIANPQNTLSNVSIDEARALFGNDIRDWSELPMSGFKSSAQSQVRAFARLHCKVRPGHWRLILDTEQQFGWNITEVSAIKDMVQQVSVTPGALGYETLWHIDRLAKEESTGVKTLDVNGASPHDREAVANGKYPLYRVFNITSWQSNNNQSDLNDELVEYLIANAHKIKEEFAIIPAEQLRKHGWKFHDNELVGEPN